MNRLVTLGLLIANAAAAALLIWCRLPHVVAVVLGCYAVCASGGLVLCRTLGLRWRSTSGLMLTVVGSFASVLLASIGGFALGVAFSGRHALLGLIVVEAIVALVGMVPVARRWQGQWPNSVLAAPRFTQAALAVVAVVAIAATLGLVGRTQRPQSGLDYTQLQLDPALARNPSLDAAPGASVAVPITLTSSRAVSDTAATVTVDGHPAPGATLVASGPRAVATVGVAAPAEPGRHRVTISVPNPTYVTAPPPSNPAIDPGRDGEAQASDPVLSVDVWIVVR